jgi:poly(3-hydroxybutyrate) depolymerase
MRALWVSIFAASVFACSGEDAADPDGGTAEDAPGGGDADAPEVGDRDAGEMDAGLPDSGMTSPGSAGCGMAHAGGETMEMIDVDGTERTFILTVPDGYDPNAPLPLIFGWHGYGRRAGDGLIGIGVRDAGRQDAIFVHANALTDAQGNYRWMLDPTGVDVDFYDALYTHVTSTLCVDENRVFSYGFSLGGYMSNMIGCVRGNQQTAIVPWAGGGPEPGWVCAGPVAALIWSRVNDRTVPISEGIESRDYWVNENSCDANTTLPVEPSPCVAYSGCAEGKPVIWCEDPMGDHVPPPPNLGSTTWTFIRSFF